MAKKDLLQYPEAAYTPVGVSLGLISEKEARKEYTRLRSIAMKRLARLEESQYGASNSSFIQYARERLKPLAQTPEGGVAGVLSEARIFLQNPLSTLRGQRERRESKIINTLKSHGYNIGPEDIRAFGNFMEWARSKLQGLMLASSEVAQLYEDARDAGINVKELERDFEQWVKHRFEVREFVGTRMSAAQIRKELGIRTPRRSKG